MKRGLRLPIDSMRDTAERAGSEQTASLSSNTRAALKVLNSNSAQVRQVIEVETVTKQAEHDAELAARDREIEDAQRTLSDKQQRAGVLQRQLAQLNAEISTPGSKAYAKAGV
jgi:predicted RNase H-like nuclease (RuvC/YqgF family)